MKRCDVDPEDLLPSKEDNKTFFQDAVEFVMNFMVANLDCLSHLKTKQPQHSERSAVKSEIAALEILDIDEASTDNNIRILEQFYKDTGKQDSQPQVQKILLLD